MVWEGPYTCRRALRLSTGYRSLSKRRWWHPVPPAGARQSTGTLSPSPRPCRCREWSVACRAGEGRRGCTALQNENKARQCSARAESKGPLQFYCHQAVNLSKLMVKTSNRPWGGRCWLLCQGPAQGQTPSGAIQQFLCSDPGTKGGYLCCNTIYLDWHILNI